MTSKMKLLTRIVVGFFMSWSLIITIVIASGANINELPAITLWSAISMAAIIVIIYFPMILAFAFCIMIVVLIAMLRFAPMKLLNIANVLNTFAREARLLVKIGFSLSETSQLIWVIAVIITVTLSVTLVLWKMKQEKIRNTILLLLGIVSLCLYWYNFINFAYTAVIVYFSMFLLLNAWDKLETKTRQWKTTAVSFPQSVQTFWMKNAMTTISIILIVMFALPKDIAPIECKWLSRAALQTFPELSELRNAANEIPGKGDRYAVKIAGFQNDNELGGPVVWSDKVLLVIEGNNLSRLHYLKGTVSDTYEDNEWHRQISQSTTIESTSNTADSITIKHTGIHTRTFFTPADFTVSLDTNRNVLVDLGNEFYTDEPVRVGEKYSLCINTAARKLEANDLLEHYLSLPKQLPDRVITLAQRIVVPYDTDYDKIRGLESYLRYYYKYSLRPNITPNNRDFVDYFLFDLKEGYCTYFAASLAVMGRAVGIPTRYVQGLLLDSIDPDSNIATAKAHNAHAWVEAYIADQGWVRLEPTPAFETEPFTPLYGGPLTYSDTDSFDYLDPNDLEMNPDEIPYDREKLDQIVSDISDTNETTGMDHLLLFRQLLTWIIYIALAVFLTVAFCKLCRTKRYLRRIDHLEPQQKVLSYYSLILKVLTRLEIKLNCGETPLEFADRIISYVYYEEVSFRELANTFSRTLYGNKVISEIKVDQFVRLFKLLEKRLSNKMGRWRYFLLKYYKGYLLE